MELWGYEARGGLCYVPHFETPVRFGDPDEYPFIFSEHRSRLSREGRSANLPLFQEFKDLDLGDEAWDDVLKINPTDMEKLGLKIISCNIQNVTDEQDLIKDLGADNTWNIRKQAKINKANAERDIAKAEAAAQQEANDARVNSETQIAIRNNELAVKRSELNIVEQSKKADADAAYAIQEQRQRKTINIETVEADSARQILEQERMKEINSKTVEAQIERARREQELTNEQIKIRQNMLEAEVAKRAEADKFQTETNAMAELPQLHLLSHPAAETRGRGQGIPGRAGGTGTDSPRRGQEEADGAGSRGCEGAG